MNATTGRNDVRLINPLDGGPGHFRLAEFANADGLAIVHACLLESLELTRADLGLQQGSEVYVIVTNATRTHDDNLALAARFGWIDEGGLVSRTSRHLVQYGGIAVDIVAFVADSGWRIPQRQLGAVCRRHFDWVKDDYQDGHVHADNRRYRGGV